MGSSSPATARGTHHLLVALVVLVATTTLLLGGRPAAALTLRGSGVKFGSELASGWATSYGYDRDDITLVFGVAVNQSNAVTMYDQGLSDFYTSFVSVDASATDPQLLQIPLAGLGLVPAYRLDALNTTLRLDAATLGKIWAGQITNWDDAAIAALNAGATPNQPIVLAFNPLDELAGGLADAFKQALAAISTDFAAAMASNGPSLTSILTAAGVTNYQLVDSSTRVSTVANNDGYLTYAGLPEVTSVAAVKSASMVRSNGSTTVTVSATSVTAALTDFTARVVNSTTGFVNIFNPPTATAWPLSTLVFASMRKDRVITGKTVACQYIEETLLFLSWTQLNDKAVAVTNALNYVGFPFGYRKKACALLEQMTCDNQTTLTTGLIVGSGAANDVYPPLAYKYPSASFQLKYYGSTTPEGISNMINANFDFGIISSSLPAYVSQAIPDIGALPITAMAIVPIYNLPELVGRPEPLVLSLSLMGDIYLGIITHWDDAQIIALNPDLDGVLPNQPIRIVYQDVFSVITAIYAKAMAFSNPAFNATVGVSNNINFPMKTANTTILLSDIQITQTVNANPYSFTPWVNNVVSSERGLAVAKLRNVAGYDVAISQESITAALNDLIDKGENDLINAPSANSWPALSINSIIIRQTSMTDCTRATSLLDWIYWTQNSTEALNQIVISGMGVVVNSDLIKRQMYKFLAGVTCRGVKVSSLANCVTADGLLCSDHGSCVNNACRCFDGYTGSQCESTVSDSSTDTTAIAIGVAVPVAVVVFLLLLAIIIALLMMLVFKRKKRDDWEIEYDELEIGSMLGSGGYGEVYKAMWKGTEVAVKMMPTDSVSKEMAKNFQDEVRVMTALRHPNVVLFMAACTRPPKMAIVMEFMALGSLFDLLHNELVPDVPHVLKVKMVYQAAKGMHFLHSSGIVHRDLKSLNLLLDAKWNVKVSDFGLTKFKAEMNANEANDVATIQWAAPEVLNETQSVDYILADVYSFGIILWEVLTREQPYYGLSPAAVAVSVIRDQARPPIPQFVPQDYEDLMTSCWHRDPAVRPTFLEVMTRLATMIEGHGTNSSSSMTSKDRSHGSWSLPSSSSGGSGHLDDSGKQEAAGTIVGVKPPEGEVAIVFTDITRAASLWETHAASMRDATLLHNNVIRELLKKHQGYEVMMKNAGEGSFCLVFQHAIDALEWCMDVQAELLEADWPKDLLTHPGAAPEWGDVDDRVLYKGLRIRMGVHVGAPKLIRDPMSRRYEYVGVPVNLTARITALAHGGQILLSGAAFNKVKSTELAKEDKRLQRLGTFDIPEQPQGTRLYELKARGLEGRFFGGISNEAMSTSSPGTDSDKEKEKEKDKINSLSNTSDEDPGYRGKDIQMLVGEGMAYQEDNFLTSANLCRWIINYNEIQIGQQVGTGSYGIVSRGKWKGVDVAVKRIIKQKLDERKMLEFRAEMAFLSELHHPNIVLFIGACVQRPNLAIVTEFVKQGSLKYILESNAKLPFKQRLRMLRSAALGINYLHSLDPTIIHRDIKPSNLLVDETWNVKVADFGFARIKEENATMTRCGTPAWTAPEIIRGEKYSEKADLYSFGVVMWEMLTRKQPYAGRNFMGVSLDVLEGKRPQIPQDCPAEYKKIMKKCWHNKPEKRPKMEDVVAFLDSLIGEDNDRDQP